MTGISKFQRGALQRVLDGKAQHVWPGLCNGGLVEQHGDRWEITPAGVAELLPGWSVWTAARSPRWRAVPADAGTDVDEQSAQVRADTAADLVTRCRQREQAGVAWTLDLDSFAGIVASASHWYARLAGRVEDVEVSYAADAVDAAALSCRDFTHRPGERSSRFRREVDARRAAIAVFGRLAGPRDVLVEKYGDPGVVLAGPADLVAAGGRCNGSGYRWALWLKQFAPHEYDRVIGHGAPPSVRQPAEAVVRRDITVDAGWVIAYAKVGDRVVIDERKAAGDAD